MLSPGTAYLLAFLPARRLAHAAKRKIVDRNAATLDPALKRGIEDARYKLDNDTSVVTDADKRLATTAERAGVRLPASSSMMTSSLLRAAWNAGETAREVGIAVELVTLIAQLRCAAPNNPDLRTQAADAARQLRASAAKLTKDLTATGLPLVIDSANSIEKYVGWTSSLEPNDQGGYEELAKLTEDLFKFMEGKARLLDTAPPEKPTAEPSAAENALVARILANPTDDRLRLELAKLAEQRKDPRAQLIRLQLAGDDRSSQQASDLIRSHPEWSAPLTALGARDIKFAAGFPDEITIDAKDFLARGFQIFATAPITRVHLRDAKGHVAQIVRSPLLATLVGLDLDNAGVTDSDIEALASSPHAARLTQLDLRFNPLTTRGFEAMAASRYLKRLEVATFDGNPADPTDRQKYFSETSYDYIPTEAGKALEAKYGRLPWLHRS